MLITGEQRAEILSFRSIAPALEFEYKRRARPEAAFADLYKRLMSASNDEEDIRRSFDELMNFHGTAVTSEQASRLDFLTRNGDVSATEFAIGTLPSSMGPGLALMYDTALEVLRTSERKTFAQWSDPRVIRTMARSMQEMLPLIGAASVTAIELVADDAKLREHLQERAKELGTAYMIPIHPGACEFCEIRATDAAGNSESYCGTKEECESFGGFMILLLAVFLLYELLDWLF